MANRRPRSEGKWEKMMLDWRRLLALLMQSCEKGFDCIFV
jgi:hypothetical protein